MAIDPAGMSGEEADEPGVVCGREAPSRRNLIRWRLLRARGKPRLGRGARELEAMIGISRPDKECDPDRPAPYMQDRRKPSWSCWI